MVFCKNLFVQFLQKMNSKFVQLFRPGAKKGRLRAPLYDLGADKTILNLRPLYTKSICLSAFVTVKCSA